MIGIKSFLLFIKSTVGKIVTGVIAGAAIAFYVVRNKDKNKRLKEALQDGVVVRKKIAETNDVRKKYDEKKETINTSNRDYFE
jgi:predicted transcriptional regulator